MKKSPLTQVKDQFGSKAELIAKLVPLLEREDGEDDAALSRRLARVPNTKLIRLWKAEQTVKEKFGSKDGLVEAISALKFPGKGNASYKAKIATFAKTRLLDLHKSLS